MLSDCKTRPATAGRGGIGVVDLEGRSDQLVGEVDLGTAQEFQAHLVDHHAGTIALDENVIGVQTLGKIELVGEAGTAAAFHRNAKQARPGLFFQNRLNALGCRRG